MRTKFGLGRLQARAEDTRRTILDSAVTLYLSQGAENTTVSAIIKRARLGRTTFYRYFKDADDVLNQAVIRDFHALMADFETQTYEHASLEEQIVEDISWFFRQLRRRPALKLLFANKGAENTTVSAIIKRARLGRTTFYRYFKDADDVLNQAVIRDFHALMADFETQTYEHASLEEQIVEDISWFFRQLRRRPALKLLFANNSRQLYERIDESLAACFNAAMACSRTTFERARRMGRLREGITLHRYVEWCMFIVMSLQTVNFPFAGNEFRLREMLKDFVVPSLVISAGQAKPPEEPESDSDEHAVEFLRRSDS